jgi:hypothetical protein
MIVLDQSPVNHCTFNCGGADHHGMAICMQQMTQHKSTKVLLWGHVRNRIEH